MSLEVILMYLYLRLIICVIGKEAFSFFFLVSFLWFTHFIVCSICDVATRVESKTSHTINVTKQFQKFLNFNRGNEKVTYLTRLFC